MNGYYSEMAERNKAIQAELEGYMGPQGTKQSGGGMKVMDERPISDYLSQYAPASKVATKAIMAA